MLAFLPMVMKNFTAFNLKWPLVAWNFFLALFSMVGTYYVVPPAVRSIQVGGLYFHLCDIEGAEELVSAMLFSCIRLI